MIFMEYLKLAFLFMVIIFAGCQDQKFDEFFEKEKTNLANIAKEIIDKLGLENFEVLACSHKSVNSSILSKSISDTRYSGTKFQPEAAFGHGYFADEDNNADIPGNNTWVQQRTLTANYKTDSKTEISYDKITLLIIFDKINEAKRIELLKLLNSYVINIERGDDVYIISKEEFNNLE
jgi:hypothetical protein